MDSMLLILAIGLLVANLVAVIFLFRRKQPDQIDNSQIFKDEVSSLKNSFSQSFGSMSKEIAKDMTGALTKVDEKVGVFNRQVSELNKSQDNFSKILSGDLININLQNSTFSNLTNETVIEGRDPVYISSNPVGVGRELFSVFRDNVSNVTKGASVFNEN